MLQSITFTDFKSYQKATLPLASLTTLVGANASGKSNALEGIRFLNWIAQGQKLSSLAYAVNDNDRVVRGTIENLSRLGERPEFGLACTLEKVKYANLKLHFSIRDEIHISQEKCQSATGEVLYETKEATQGVATDIAVAYNNFARGGKKPQVTCSDQQGIFYQLTTPGRINPVHKESIRKIPAATQQFEKALANILYLDPVPAKMRGYSFKSERVLHGDGGNLSAVLSWLWENKNNQKEEILALIQSLPEQDIVGLDFLTTPRGEKMVQLEESFGGEKRKIEAALLSDGTLRVLAIAAALLSAAPGSLVIIEEADNGVHPNRTQHLLTTIEKLAVERDLKVLITTHNPAMLNALPTTAIGDVVFCYRDKENGNSKLTKLEDLPDYPELIGQGGVGDLLTEGILERFIKYHPGPEKKRKDALAWLDSIA